MKDKTAENNQSQVSQDSVRENKKSDLIGVTRLFNETSPDALGGFPAKDSYSYTGKFSNRGISTQPKTQSLPSRQGNSDALRGIFDKRNFVEEILKEIREKFQISDEPNINGLIENGIFLTNQRLKAEVEKVLDEYKENWGGVIQSIKKRLGI